MVTLLLPFDGGSEGKNFVIIGNVVFPLDIADFKPLIPDISDEFAQGHSLIQFDVSIDDAGTAAQKEIHFMEDCQNQKYAKSCDQGYFVKSDADGEADTGGSPKACGGGQTFDLIMGGDHDGAGTQKTDAADDLCAQTDRVAGAEI